MIAGQINLVGLSGYASVGKDEVAKAMRPAGWVRIAFADPLKEVATAIGWNGEKDDAGRALLQALGVAVRDYVHPDAWVMAAEACIEELEWPVVVTDVRFRNELEMIKRRGGLMVRVERPGVTAVNGHISEHILGPEDCDVTFHNNGTLEMLPHVVDRFFTGIDLRSRQLAAA